MKQNKTNLGIDLGTSNSALATFSDETSSVLNINQQLSSSTFQEKDSLPSVIYTDPQSSQAIVGHWAKEMAQKQVDRTVSSAKSWLCNSQVDRSAAILPWGSEQADAMLSPIAASTAILRQLSSQYSSDNVVITVPASFDETARRLTTSAAKDAGFEAVTLLEEPLAALYSWISHDKEQWREQVSDGDLILVCDIGGGTSDFSLVAVSDNEGQLNLERISVGRHLLLGGDNMDLALAYRAKWQLEQDNHSIDDWQLASLVYQASKAKETLLSDDTIASVKVGIESRGSNLFASAISVEIQQEWVQQILMDGFFPQCTVEDETTANDNSGLQEFGLQYESDPAITKHLAEFLRSAASNVVSDERLTKLCDSHLQGNFIKPTKVLFNGGVFNSPQLVTRVTSILSTWCAQDVQALSGSSFNHAVAQGAAFYASLKASGEGLRIRSGTAKSFYLGVESGMMAIPGFKQPTKGLCIVPQGTEEGITLRLPKKTFALKAGQSVNFKFYTSRERAGDQLGDVVADAEKQLEDSFTLTASIPKLDESENAAIGQSYPVSLDADIDELGTMNLKMQHTQSEKSWELELDVRRHD